eukprot:GHVH01000846.1.p1 GENE.GHVH01000846.1~~GHVH01000846.1.p1  ORF type:complete len:205 (-),score=22.76 GHVH01000846.1:62-655(-)
MFLSALISSLFSAAGPNVVPLDAAGLIPYLGRWLQLGASSVVFKTFERGGSCINANYSNVVQSGDSLSFDVLNTQIVNGQLESINGKATVADIEEAGRIEVAFPGVGFSIPDLENYLIVGLGDVWTADDAAYSDGYEWAVVTDPFRLFSFVLGRHPDAYTNNKQSIDDAIEDAKLWKTALVGNKITFQDHIDCDNTP